MTFLPSTLWYTYILFALNLYLDKTIQYIFLVFEAAIIWLNVIVADYGFVIRMRDYRLFQIIGLKWLADIAIDFSALTSLTTAIKPLQILLNIIIFNAWY